jgi:hypothetical protein
MLASSSISGLKELINEKHLLLGGSSEDSELILNYEEKAFD